MFFREKMKCVFGENKMCFFLEKIDDDLLEKKKKNRYIYISY